MADLAQIRQGFAGLATSLSAEAAPPGALLEATNVCIRTENVITPRPAFAISTLPAALDTEAIGRVEYPIGTNEAGLMIDATATRWDGGSGSAGAVVDENAGNLVWTTYEGAVARRNLFLCTSDALRRVEEPDADVAYRAGVPVPYISAVAALSVAGDAAVPTGHYRAYRAVARRTALDGNGTPRTMRSAPSGRHVLHPLGSDQDVQVRVLIHEHDDWRTGDVIELYGSETGETYPTDELYLIAEAEVDLTAMSAGAYVVTINDRVPTDRLGAALYTNTSREGAEAANVRPPAAACMETFNGSLWLGNLTYPAQLEVSFLASRDETAAASTEGIGRRTIGGTTTSGNATVTGVSGSDIAKVKVGMFVFSGGGTWTVSGGEAPRVTAVGADNFTVNGTAGSSATGAIVLEDGFRVGSYYAPARWLAHYMRNGDVSASSGGYVAHVSSTLYTAIATEDEWSDISNQPTAEVQRRFFVSTLLANTAAPQVWATNGHLYTPVLPEPSEATGYTMPQEVLPDHVAWSKADEPDHFPLTNLERVGNGGATAYALGVTRGAILIATDQGLWRGYGHADSSIGFSELDKGVRILGARCMAPGEYSQYIAADRGVFECDENGATNITEDRINDLDAIFAAIAAARSSALKVVSNEKNDEILVCVPEDETAGAPINDLYVFNYHTRAWTLWTLPADVLDVTVKGPNRIVRATLAGVEGQFREDADAFADGNPLGPTAVTVNSVDGTTVVLSSSAFGIEVGDAIVDGDTFIVTALNTSTSIEVHKAGMTTGAKSAYKAINCRVTPSVNTLKTPRFMKLWAEGSVLWAKRAGIYSYGLEFRSAITGATAAASQTRVLAPDLGANTDARSAPAVSRFTVPRAAARGTHLCFSIVVKQALSDWAIEGLTVRARTTADKPPARLP